MLLGRYKCLYFIFLIYFLFYFFSVEEGNKKLNITQSSGADALVRGYCSHLPEERERGRELSLSEGPMNLKNEGRRVEN